MDVTALVAVRIEIGIYTHLFLFLLVTALVAVRIEIRRMQNRCTPSRSPPLWR